MAEYIKKEKLFDCLDIKNALGGHYGISLTAINAIPAADVVPGRDFRDCRNELCLRCGEYKMRHKGACDGCRWRDA